MFNFFLFSRRTAQRLAAGTVLGLLVLLVPGVCSAAQSPSAPSIQHSAADRGRILLVIPFDNRTGELNLDWIREAAANLLSSRFASAGFAPMTRADRVYALDHLGLPPNFQPSRASEIKLAQTLDADSIIVGSFSLNGQDLVAQAEVVNVPHLKMLAPVTAQGPMTSMIAIFDRLAWKLTRQLDPSLNVAEETFVAEGSSLRLSAYEQYIRGITEPDQAERMRHLATSVKLSPDFSPAWMALGREEYRSQQYDRAAEAFSRVDRKGPDGLEASFYRGLSLLFSGNYPEAYKEFSEVAKTLPLAEVVNNEGVALSREGRDGTPQFIQAAADDPRDADYHFNLAVSLKRHGNSTAALNELTQCLKLRPNDSEAASLLQAWKYPAAATAVASTATADPPPAPDPLERIARTFDETAFRQASQMLDEMDARRVAALSPQQRARTFCAQAKGYLSRGLVLEAERLYQMAATADPKSADAHLGLARVRLRSGDLQGARREARQALALSPGADAHLILARADLAAHDLKNAQAEAESAVQADPANTEAQQLLHRIQTSTVPGR